MLWLTWLKGLETDELYFCVNAEDRLIKKKDPSDHSRSTYSSLFTEQIDFNALLCVSIYNAHGCAFALRVSAEVHACLCLMAYWNMSVRDPKRAWDKDMEREISLWHLYECACEITSCDLQLNLNHIVLQRPSKSDVAYSVNTVKHVCLVPGIRQTVTGVTCVVR